ncbi:hypothetical protein FRC08_006389 [Ceratobasidium sp. 394]|nr:hypothetical protein FRC08_006389 [Ceratobasidium sp. 394]
MKLSIAFFSVITAVALHTGNVRAGPMALALCTATCQAGYTTCCAAAGTAIGIFTFGLGTPVAVAGCSLARGACVAACAPLLAAQGP